MRLVTSIALFLLLCGSATAFSGFPTDYPYNQYGHESTFYSGPWGEYRVYGAYGYFPQPYGYHPYGYAQYGHFYTPWNLRTGVMPGMQSQYRRPY